LLAFAHYYKYLDEEQERFQLLCLAVS